MIEQMTLDELMAEPVPSFSAIAMKQNEAECPPERMDETQWSKQLRAVYDVMKDGRWRTLAEIAFEASAPEASVSARIRDLKNGKGIQHEKRRSRNGGLFEYKLIITSQDVI